MRRVRKIFWYIFLCFMFVCLSVCLSVWLFVCLFDWFLSTQDTIYGAICKSPVATCIIFCEHAWAHLRHASFTICIIFSERARKLLSSEDSIAGLIKHQKIFHKFRKHLLGKFVFDVYCLFVFSAIYSKKSYRLFSNWPGLRYDDSVRRETAKLHWPGLRT